MKIRDVMRALERDGWRIDRTRGSRRQYKHPTKPGTITVAGKASTDLHPSESRNILRRAGLDPRQ